MSNEAITPFTAEPLEPWPCRPFIPLANRYHLTIITFCLTSRGQVARRYGGVVYRYAGVLQRHGEAEEDAMERAVCSLVDSLPFMGDGYQWTKPVVYSKKGQS